MERRVASSPTLSCGREINSPLHLLNDDRGYQLTLCNNPVIKIKFINSRLPHVAIKFSRLASNQSTGELSRSESIVNPGTIFDFKLTIYSGDSHKAKLEMERNMSHALNLFGEQSTTHGVIMQFALVGFYYRELDRKINDQWLNWMRHAWNQTK